MNVDGEVKYSLFANAIRTATTSIPALPARQRVIPWAEDEDTQAFFRNWWMLAETFKQIGTVQ